MRKVAVIGIGSNSVRMLVAEVEEDGFRRLTRDREGTRLFAGLDGEGNLRRDSMEKTAAAVQRMALSSRARNKSTMAASSMGRASFPLQSSP